jgi:hypothetical protein
MSTTDRAVEETLEPSWERISSAGHATAAIPEPQSWQSNSTVTSDRYQPLSPSGGAAASAKMLGSQRSTFRVNGVEITGSDSGAQTLPLQMPKKQTVTRRS